MTEVTGTVTPPAKHWELQSPANPVVAQDVEAGKSATIVVDYTNIGNMPLDVTLDGVSSVVGGTVESPRIRNASGSIDPDGTVRLHPGETSRVSVVFTAQDLEPSDPETSYSFDINIATTNIDQ